MSRDAMHAPTVSASQPTRWLYASLIAQTVLLVYLEVVEWVAMFPWNDIRRGNGQETLDIALGVAMTLVIAVTLLRWRPGIVFGLLVYIVWFGLQVSTFWIPYTLGASERWARVHSANFAQTVQWLPNYENHLPPDANHFVLQLILVAALITTAVAARRPKR